MYAFGAVGLGKIEFVGNGTHLSKYFEWSNSLGSKFMHWLCEFEVGGVEPDLVAYFESREFSAVSIGGCLHEMMNHVGR